MAVCFLEGKLVSAEEAFQIVLGRPFIGQERVFYCLWRHAPELAIRAAEEVLNRIDQGIPVSSRLLKISQEIKKGGPVISTYSCRVNGYVSLERVFSRAESFDVIEISFSIGKSGFAALASLARFVRGTPLEDSCLYSAEKILHTGKWPGYESLFRFSVPNGLPPCDLKLIMKDLAWAIWAGVDGVSCLSHLKVAGNSTSGEDSNESLATLCILG